MKDHVTIVVPAYNEAEVLDLFAERMAEQFVAMPDVRFEILFVNDGSTDETLNILKRLSAEIDHIGYVSLSRNFGKEAAMTAGFDLAKGDAVATFDADLQDPPELLVDFIRHWRDGFDVVYAQRTQREGESWIKKSTASAFYKFMGRVSRVKIPRDTGDCRLMSRRAVDSLNKLREHHRFMKGLFSWIGYPAIAVPYKRDARAAGTTKFNYWKLWNFALEGITAFTEAPLKLATYVGFLTALSALVMAVYFVVKTLIFGDAVQGFPTLMVTILLLGGVQMFFIGILGEYLGRVFNESKRRPIYLVDEANLPD